MKKGRWSPAEDDILREYIKEHGEGNWHLIEKNSILPRSGKSCRLRWLNHLRPGLEKCPISSEEEDLLIELHERMGNKWALMAKEHFPGRSDNELKNFWNKRARRGPVDGGGFDQQQIDAEQHRCDFNAQETPGTAADEEQTGWKPKRQKCDRNSTCPDSDRVELESGWQNIDEDCFDSLEVDAGAITDERALPNAEGDEILYENPAVIAEDDCNSVAGSEYDRILPQFNFWMPDELLIETLLKENYLMTNSTPMSEDEIAMLLEQSDHLFESESGHSAYGMLTSFEGHRGGLPNASESNKKEAAAVDVEPLPIATVEEEHVLSKESLEQSWSNRSWNETFSGCNFAMDWELLSVQNKGF